MERRRQFSGEEIQRLVADVRQLLSGMQEVDAAWIHGSVAEGAPARDVDVALLVAPASDGWEVANRVALELDRQVPVGLEWDVRPVDEAAPPAIRRAVVAAGLRVAQNDRDRRVLFEADAVRDWLDIQPFLEAERNRYLRRLAGDG